MPRARLKRVSVTRESKAVLVHGFGANHGKPVKIGYLVKRNPYTCVVALRDDSGAYEERFSLVSGVRTRDIGSPDGWALSLEDLKTSNVPALPVKGQQTRKVFERTVPLCEREVVVWQVFRTSRTNDVYVKAYRRKESVKETGETVTRDYPALMPLFRLKELIQQYEDGGDGQEEE